MKPIRIFQHQSWIGPGRLAEALSARELPFEIISIDRRDAIPSTVDDVSALVFLGGTMSVNDRLTWIEAELALIREGQARGIPILGHCLGSQLISKALGGTVDPMPAKEIGWYTVRRNEGAESDRWLAGVPSEVEILIWHHDAFTLPPGASPLYSSAYCPDQAFVLGNTLATVAHVEVTAPLLRDWLDIYGYDIAPISDSVQPIEDIRQSLDARVQHMHATLTDRLYEAWLSRVMQS